MSNLYTDSFCDRLAWIHRNSQGAGLKKLDRYYKSELLKAIYNARNQDFTEFEIEVLVLVVSYCCYYIQNWAVPWDKFKEFKKPEQYYSAIKKLVASKEKIRYKAVPLSNLIDDPYLSESVRQLESE